MKCTFGVDRAHMLLVEEVESLLNFENVCLIEARTVVGTSVKLRLEWLLLCWLISSAHVNYYDQSCVETINFNESYIAAE